MTSVWNSFDSRHITCKLSQNSTCRLQPIAGKVPVANGILEVYKKPCSGILRTDCHGCGPPLFEQLTQNPEYLVVNKNKPPDLIFITFFLCLVLPGLFSLFVLLSSRVSARFGKWSFQAVLIVLIGALVMVALNRLIQSSSLFAIGLGLLLTAGIVAGYNRFRSVRLFFNFLAPAIIIVPVLFLIHPSIQKFFRAKQTVANLAPVRASAPIIMVIFDELPLSSLVNAEQQIDPDLFPNFASLAQDSFWFRNATTVSDYTVKAVPSILTGRYPHQGEMPVYYDNPKNLFSLLGATYQIRATELATFFCPEEICGKGEESGFVTRIVSTSLDLSILYAHLILPYELAGKILPPVSEKWGNFWNNESNRAGRFQQFVESISPGNKPGLYFIHTELPHRPFSYMPSGEPQTRRFINELRERVLAKFPAGKDSLVNLDRHLLQVLFVDSLLGKLIHHLKSVGLYDQSLIVITADHGICFHRGQSLRSITRTNYQDIMLIPLLIKLPHQQQGIVSDRNVETIDILPTIADALEIEAPWTDGTSALDDTKPERDRKQVFFGSGPEDQFMKFDRRIEANPKTLEQKLLLQTSGLLGQEYQLASKTTPVKSP